MKTYTVVFTTDEMEDGAYDNMYIDAPDIGTAYEIVNAEFPDMIINDIY